MRKTLYSRTHTSHMWARRIAGARFVPQAILTVRPCRHPAVQPPFFGQRSARTRTTARPSWRRASARASRRAADAVKASAAASPLALMLTGRHLLVPYGLMVIAMVCGMSMLPPLGIESANVSTLDVVQPPNNRDTHHAARQDQLQ